MDIEYQLTQADILAQTRYQQQHVTGRRNPAQMRRVAYSVGFTAMAIGIWLFLHDMILTVLLLAFAGLSWRFYPAYFDWLIRRKVSRAFQDEKYRATMAQRRFSATEEDLREISAWGNISVKWNGVSDIAATPTHTFFTIMGQAGSLVIPRDGIVVGDYEKFVSACRLYTQGKLH